jgi:glycosyltransferase involved in cell wall biosynthesis
VLSERILKSLSEKILKLKTMNKTKHTYQITIPVLNEELRLEPGIRETMRFLQENKMDSWTVEIADNGSTDKTQEIAEQLVKEYKGRLKFRKIPERGVGLALRYSWNDAQSDIVGYMDVDLATDLKHLIEVQEIFENDQADVVNGSRLMKGSKVVGRTLKREISSRALNAIMKFRLRNKFTDAMTGFKFFKRSIVTDLLKDVPVIPDWFVSAELLVRAEWKGLRLREIPVLWTDEPNSKVNIQKLAKQYLGHIARLRVER